MNKTALFLIFLSILLAVYPGRPAKSEGEKYLVGGLSIYGGDQDATYKDFISHFAKIIGMRERAAFDIQWYSDRDKFLKLIKEKKFDYIFPSGYDVMVYSLGHGYEPFLAPSVGGKEKDNFCIYGKQDGKIKTLPDVRGGKTMVVGDQFYFYLIRKMVGESPLDFFGRLREAPNSNSAVYAFAMGELDVLFFDDFGITYFKAVNSGPVKGLKALACSGTIFQDPALRSSKVPEEQANRMRKYFVNAGKDKAFKDFWPLMKMINGRLIEVSKSDYKPVLDIFAEAQKNGWDKEYQKWLKMAKSAK